MKIDHWYPAPIKLINCEFDTLEFLKDSSFCYEKLPILANDAYTYYSKQYKRDRKYNFEFESNFDIKVDGKDGTTHIGALIKSKDGSTFENITHYLVICKKEGTKKRLLRKYHFDYAPSHLDHRQPHPVFHLQDGGKLSQKLKRMNIYDSDLDPRDFWLSEPRLCCMPISLALLVNLILKEFPDEKNHELIEKSEWRDLVKKNEELILSPFFEGCRKFFSRDDKNKLFVNDFYYGN